MSEATILAGIKQMQHKIENLEKELSEVQAILEHVLIIIPPVVFTMPDGSKRPFRPNKPISLKTLATMMRVEALSQERRHLSADERMKTFLQNIEEARTEAIEGDLAIDDEREAARDD